MNKSTIEWTEATGNPVTGCDRVTAGCDNCYKLALAKRLKAMGAEKYQNDGNPIISGPGFGLTTHPEVRAQPAKWKRFWPENVWIGTSVEEPKVLNCVADLAQVSAAVRFFSCEPLIAGLPDLPLDCTDWVIAGGESGPRHREMQAEWVRDIRDQCLTADVPFFFKQWGGRMPKQKGRELDGRLWDGYPRADSRGTHGEARI